MTSASPAAGGGNTIKTIIIGVATTVLGSAAVYFLGFHDKENNAKKEATESALNSIFQYEQILEKTIINLSCSNDSGFQSVFLDELEQVKNNMRNIRNEKDVDNRVLSIIDRRIRSVDEMKRSAEKYFDQYNELAAGNLLETEAGINRAYELQRIFYNEVEQISQREKTFLTDIITALDKEYKLAIKIQPLSISVTESGIAGSWLINKTVQWDINPDHSFTWAFNAEQYSGKWTLKDDIIRLEFSHPEVANLKVIRLYPDYIVYRNLDDSTVAEACRR